MNTDKKDNCDNKSNFIPKYESNKVEDHYEWKIYLPGVNFDNINASIDDKKRVIIIYGKKDDGDYDVIYRNVYGFDIPKGEFNLEIPFPEDELNFDEYVIKDENGTLKISIKLKNPDKKVLMKKGILMELICNNSEEIIPDLFERLNFPIFTF